MTNPDSPTDVETWNEQFQDIIRMVQTSPRFFKTAPWEEEKLIFIHIREAMETLTKQMRAYAKERLNGLDC